jgi:hypothetical protein
VSAIGELLGCRAQPHVVDERTVALHLDDDGCPGLATLVAAVEYWRGSSRAGEVSLALAVRCGLLRTKT